MEVAYLVGRNKLLQDRLAVQLRALLRENDYHFDRPLLVGVSGGPDSLVLLHIMRELLPGGTLAVAHLNHALRPEAQAESEVLAALADMWGVPLFVRKRDVEALAKAAGWSVEEAGRHARYEFLAEQARELGMTNIAVGHNADDQAETVLLHILRGSGLAGLRGMSVDSPVPGAYELRLWRPLLSISRDEIEAYASRHGLEPFLDESNLNRNFARNRLRNEILPVLAADNPQIKRQFRQIAAITAAEDDLLNGLTDEVWPTLLHQIGPNWLLLDRGIFAQQPLALRRRIIRKAVAQLAGSVLDLSFAAVEQAVDVATNGRTGSRASLPGGLTLQADYETVILIAGDMERATNMPQMRSILSQNLPIPGRVALANGWVLTANHREPAIQDVKQNRDPWKAFVAIDADLELVVRTRKEGERIQPLGLHGRSTSIQDLFVNRKVPARLRSLWPIVSTAQHPVWVVGQVIDHRVQVPRLHDNIVVLTCHPTAVSTGDETSTIRH